MAAQNAAHILTTRIATPSLFELIASQSLDAAFYPAFKKIAFVRSIKAIC